MLTAVDSFKSRAGQNLGDEKFVDALKCYKLADKMLREYEQREVEPYQKGLVRQHKAQIFNQVALCYSQLGDHEKVVEFSTKVI